MKTILFSLLSLLLFSCNEHPEEITDPLLDLIPEASSFIVRTQDYELLKKQLNNNLSVSNFIEKSSFKNTKPIFKSLLNVTSKGPAIICLREIGKNSIDFLLLSQSETAPQKAKEEQTAKKYQENSIIKYRIDINTENETYLYGTQMGNTVLISSSELMIENAIRSKNKKNNKELTQLFKTSKNNTIFAKLDKKSWLYQNNFTPIPGYHFGAWSVLNYNFEPDNISLNGFNSTYDSLPSFLNLFKNSKAGPLKSLNFIPQNTKKSWIYRISDYDDFKSQQKKLLNKSTASDTLFKHIEEVALLQANKRFTGLLHFAEINNTELFLSREDQNPDEFQETAIYKINGGTRIKESFAPLLDSLQTDFGAVFGQTLILAATYADIQTALTSIKTEATLSKDPYFLKSKETIADESSVLFYESYSTNFRSKNIIDFFIPPALKKDEAYTLSNQWVADNGFFHQHLNLSKQVAAADTHAVRPLFSIDLDTAVGTTLQWVKNHLTQEKDIVVQDKNNNLYLINNKGKILWKKELNSPIQGAISQVDIYKNGRLQLAFTTKDQWLILDRNGDEVRPFNKKFSGEQLGPLAVFDYDKNKEYRFVFSSGKNIYMYDRNGQKVKGFGFTKASSNIIGVPKHFRIKGKDFLVFKTSKGELLIKNRIGKTRVSLNKKFKFSDNPVMLLESQFSFTDLNGNLIQIDEDGKTKTKNLRVNATHKTTHLNNQLLVLEDNILYSKGKQASLDFGIYSLPKIESVGKKTYISITDTQNEKIYLFNENLESLPKFPVFGTAVATLSDMNGNGELNLLSQQATNMIIVYGIKIPK